MNLRTVCLMESACNKNNESVLSNMETTDVIPNPHIDSTLGYSPILKPVFFCYERRYIIINIIYKCMYTSVKSERNKNIFWEYTEPVSLSFLILDQFPEIIPT